MQDLYAMATIRVKFDELTCSGEADTFDHHAPRCRAVNAILLAAGYGTRIRSLFPDTPKALIEVGGRALIDHLLANLARSGVVESALVVTNDRYHAALQRHLSAATPPAPPASRSGSAPWATCTSPCAGWYYDALRMP